MTLASFGTKILSFLMVPLYTNILSTEAYLSDHTLFDCSSFVIEYCRWNYALLTG